jgi:hypothetical protein
LQPQPAEVVAVAVVIRVVLLPQDNRLLAIAGKLRLVQLLDRMDQTNPATGAAPAAAAVAGPAARVEPHLLGISAAMLDHLA